MLQFTENFIDYVWQNGLFDLRDLQTTQGKRIEILQFGKKNLSDGPDYFNGRVRIGKTIWVGNVELHVKASDWLLHRHQHDSAYHNVVLHVVLNADREILDHLGQVIPTLELKSRIPRHVYEHFQHLRSSQRWIPCEMMIESVPKIRQIQCLDRMCIERLQSRVIEVKKILLLGKNDWESCARMLLARAFGGPINGETFMRIISSLPKRAISQSLGHSFRIQSLLLGHSGMLDLYFQNDDYLESLHREYKYLAKKYQLQPLKEKSCKFFGLRPGGFPSIRLAQLAALFFSRQHLFSDIKEIRSSADAQQFLALQLPEYWNTHYSFKSSHQPKVKKLSKSFTRLLLINAICPLQFAWASLQNNLELKEQALDLLQSLPPEQNSIVDEWRRLGLEPKTAADSQALLHLKKQYCDKKKCLNCQIGHALISAKPDK